jgi:hypothetical protein
MSGLGSAIPAGRVKAGYAHQINTTEAELIDVRGKMAR